MVPVTQYNVIVVSSSSLVNRRSTSPTQSLQAANFFAIQAATPAGECATADAGAHPWRLHEQAARGRKAHPGRATPGIAPRRVSRPRGVPGGGEGVGPARNISTVPPRRPADVHGELGEGVQVPLLRAPVEWG